MANVSKLKDKAREFEHKGQWKEALATYEQMVDETDGEQTGLWNRIGDLHMRLGQTEQAVSAYEHAVEAYSEAGLHNNAIALCHKILRAVPGRAPTYLRLGQLSAAQGFMADARSGFLQYAERMQQGGQTDAALAALREFAGLSPTDTEVRRLLADQLRARGHADEAVEQLRLLLGQLQQQQRTQEAEEVRAEILTIDPDASVDALGVAAPTPARGSGRDTRHDAGFELLPTFDMPAEPSATTATPPVSPPAEEEDEASILDFHINTTAETTKAAEVLHLDGFESTVQNEPLPEMGSDEDTLLFDVQVDGNDLDAQPTALEPEPAEVSEVGALEGFESTVQQGYWDETDEADEGAGALPFLEVRPDPAEARDDSLPTDALLFDQDELLEETEGEAEPLPLLSLDTGWAAPEPVETPADGLELLDSPPAATANEFTAPADDELPPLVDESPAAHPAAELVEDPLDELRARYTAHPGDAAARQELVARLRERGINDEAETILETAQRQLADEDRYADAVDVVRTLLDLRRDDTALHQKQVEYAFRSGDRERLIQAYLDLGHHLETGDSPAKAVAVFQRVLELDPGNADAKRALTPPASAGAGPQSGRPGTSPDPGYVDLAALIFDEEPQEPSTRFVVEEQEPTGDEERDFADVLSRFRQKVAENISVEDSSSHYDLGLAFKDMGLLDEAISQFQVALRGGANPLATLEVLGECFIEKGQYTLASRVLERALRLPDVEEASLIGVYYGLGRCEETEGHFDRARDFYERVLSLDIDFRDAASRVDALREPRSL